MKWGRVREGSREHEQLNKINLKGNKKKRLFALASEMVSWWYFRVLDFGYNAAI